MISSLGAAALVASTSPNLWPENSAFVSELLEVGEKTVPPSMDERCALIQAHPGQATSIWSHCVQYTAQRRVLSGRNSSGRHPCPELIGNVLDGVLQLLDRSQTSCLVFGWGFTGVEREGIAVRVLEHEVSDPRFDPI
ncbi:hypothetical protein B2J88_47760 [Rhodococcus sp. SRB_17]|nr:hypothetical protein [Rhodococcus sp. SRB_17]